MSRRLVCFCNAVEELEIRLYLQKGALSTNEIQFLTRAGTTCGKCLPEIDQIVSSYKREKPEDSQRKLDFGL